MHEGDFALALVGVSIADGAQNTQEAVDIIAGELNSGQPLLLANLPLPGSQWNQTLPPSEFAAACQTALAIPFQYDRPGWAERSTVALPASILVESNASFDWFADIIDCLKQDLFEFVVLHEPSTHATKWSWPVRIGVLSADGTLGSIDRLRRHHWSGILFHVVRARDSHEHFDLLLVNGPDELALSFLHGTATAVVLLAESLSKLTHELAAHAAVREATLATMSVRQQPAEELDRWLYHVVEELAHGHALHEVLNFINHAPTQPLIVGDRKTMKQLDLESGVEGLFERAQQLQEKDQEVWLNRRLQNDLGLSQTASISDVIDSLRGSIDSLMYDMESAGATTIGEAANVLAQAERGFDQAGARREMDEMAAAREASPTRGPLDTPELETMRVLRARLLCEGEPAAQKTPLAPDTPYVIQVSVGRPSVDWLGLAAPFVTPDAPPDDPDRGWRLRVIAWDPTFIPDPIAHDLWLPPKGPSQPVDFAFHSGEPRQRLGARITVLHGNRVLQTGLLVRRSDDSPLSWTVDAAPEPQLGMIDRNRWFAASIVVNDDADGVPRATIISDNELGVVDLNDVPLQSFTAAVSGQLSDIADAPELYDALDGDKTVALLSSLAQHGWNLYETLLFDTTIDKSRMASAERIQIVSARPTSYFPAEFLYTFEAPDPDAMLCPGAKDALISLDGKCSHTHTRAHVCPTGFWSLSKVVERHAFKPQETGGAFMLLNDTDFSDLKPADPLRHIMFAASQKVDGFQADSTAELMNRADAVAGGFTEIKSLDDWRQSVNNDQPSLFVLLPHHYRQDGHEKFEIGANLVIQPSEVRDDLVKVDDTHRPLILLVGCETVDSRIRFDSFVQKFRRYGAAAVISTFATILGRHAAPATGDLLEELSKHLDNGPVRLGDVILDVRRKLLADGTPMILGLTAYGDADVIFARD